MAVQPTGVPFAGAEGPGAVEASRAGTGRRAVHRVADHRPLNPRTLVGALLVTASAVGLYVAATPDDGPPGAPIVVAATDIRPGEQIEAAHLELERGLLPRDDRAFASVDDVVGRVALGPVASGEVLQSATVSAERAPREGAHEVALSLPPANVAVGRLRVGDRVDVLVTDEDETRAVVRGVPVVLFSTGSDDVLGSGRDVRLVVAVESPDAVTELVHALRTGEVTLVRSTFVRESPGEDTAGSSETEEDE